MCRCVGSADVQLYRCVDVQVCRCADVQVCRCAGVWEVQMYSCTGV